MAIALPWLLPLRLVICQPLIQFNRLVLPLAVIPVSGISRQPPTFEDAQPEVGFAAAMPLVPYTIKPKLTRALPSALVGKPLIVLYKAHCSVPATLPDREAAPDPSAYEQAGV